MEKKDVKEQLEKLLADFEKNYSTKLQVLEEVADKMKVACDKVKESWSGSCFGYHSRLYYGNFERPQLGEAFSVEWGGLNGLSSDWQELTSEEVKAKIESIVGRDFNIDKFEKENEKLADEIENFQTQIEILISSVTGKEASHPFSGIEKIEPRKKLKSYLKSYMSHNMMSRDSEAVFQGVFIPAIIYYEAAVYEAESIVSNAKKFLKATKHFVKWYELQGKPIDTGSDARPILTDLSLLHPDIFSKCQRGVD